MNEAIPYGEHFIILS